MPVDLMADVQKRYTQARERVLAVRHRTPDALVASGDDRLDLLHRMSTNAVAELTPGEAPLTVLTNALGRIVDAVRVVAAGEQALILTSPGRGEQVREWLRGYVFFNDDVKFEPVAVALSAWGVYGPKADDEIARLDHPHDLLSLHADEHFFAMWRVSRPLAGWRLLLGRTATAEAEAIWGSAADAATVQAYEALRVEDGLPRSGHEYTPDITPLEGGLEFAVDPAKGCYIGQEVIARMQSRERVPRRIVAVKLTGPAQPGEELQLDGRKIGQLTSVVQSPVHGWIGMAQVSTREPSESGAVELAERGIKVELSPLRS